MTGSAAHRLTRSATVARGAAWNLAGRLAPLLIAVPATPFLIEALGLARWGLFALGLGLVGMFGALDLGVGRALTRAVAAELGGGGAADPTAPGAAGAVRAGVLLLAGLGTVGGAALAAGAQAYVAALPGLPAGLATEAALAFAVLALAAPLVLVNAALWGVLAAHQRFGAANAITIPILAAYYLGPLALLSVWDSLVGAMAVLVVCRAAMTWAYWTLCRRAMPSLRGAGIDRRSIGPLVRQGGWMTLANVLWPLQQYLDRFVIAARLSAEAAAHYATPFDVVIRLAVLGQAVLASAFPAMATGFGADPHAVGRLARHSLLAIAALLLPCCLGAALFADPLLALWLGADFSAPAAPVLRWLAAGVLVHSLDGVAAALIDSAGRSRRNALLALTELAFYLPILVSFIDRWGVEGAAIAWSGRAVFGCSLRLWLAVGVHAPLRTELAGLLPAAAAASAAVAVALVVPDVIPFGLRAMLVVMLPVPATALAWRYGLATGERRRVVQRLWLR